MGCGNRRDSTLRDTGDFLTSRRLDQGLIQTPSRVVANIIRSRVPNTQLSIEDGGLILVRNALPGIRLPDAREDAEKLIAD